MSVSYHVMESLFCYFSSTSEKYDVMLSYQWDNQVFVKEIKQYLQSNGLTVWMDVEEMYWKH